METNIYIDVNKDEERNKSERKKSEKNEKSGRNGYSCFDQVKGNLYIIFLLRNRGYSWSDIARLEGMSYSSLMNSIDKAVFEKLTSDHKKNECCKCCIKNLSGCL